MQLIEIFLTQQLGEPVTVSKQIPVGGGCINDCYALFTNAGKFFVKINDAKQFPGMFAAEAKGLQLLAEKNQQFVPKVIVQFEDDDKQYLILEFIETGKAGERTWKNFASNLVQQHRHTSLQFGLAFDNYMGSLPQSNQFENTWSEFFILHRLEPQAKLAVDGGQLAVTVAKKFEQLFFRLSDIFPPEKPALIHGDLWSGNFMISASGEAMLIDPAAYYGHREADIAMTKLFGSFDRSFYDHYQELFPMEKGFERRADIYNLYPLLIHVNLFGGGYASQVESIIKRF